MDDDGAGVAGAGGGGPRVDVVRGDITAQRVDAVVNAANSGLLGGGGVDGAIHRAGGPAVLAACRALRATSHRAGLPTGEAVATTGGQLAARWVIHTVGPKAWEHDDGGAALLAACHRHALEVAESVGATSVAFPAISCGVYGWQPRDAAPIAVRAVREHRGRHVTLVRFVLFDGVAYDAFAAAVSG